MRQISRGMAVAALTAMVCVGTRAAAQVRASEQGLVSQTIDGTTITIEYSRPVARGRDSLFGGVVHWGTVWTPGANWATTIEADKLFRLNGQEVPAGKYGVWMLPRADTTWTVFLVTDVRRFHTQRPVPEDGVVRVAVEPRRGPYMETLSWYFPVVAPDGALLRMHWGETFVPLRVTVEPSRTWTLDAADAQPFLGQYVFTMEGDSTGRAAADPVTLTVHHHEGRLTVQWGDASLEDDTGMALLPARDGKFYPAVFRDGKLFDVRAETIIVFRVENGSAMGFEMRENGEMVGVGERVR